ncbi:hypothetical protein B4N89_44855 [Embleya scabrispora]|uniref:DUF8094 domain-containing protein n=1 Tax=Embleya scabrispora TaxID=159449 RepID=A0A1T3NIS3_9ACTN|nr:hypothetical protein [Embleya scabrispora]OPC76625.1 hypothetical protein B4N89_44855 [Embleya scabrispora]
MRGWAKRLGATVVLVWAGTTVLGCSSGGGRDSASAPSASTVVPAPDPPVISEAEARKVLEHYDTENNAANAALDGDRLAGVEGGELLEGSLAAYRADRLVKDRKPYEPFTHLEPRFWIPRGSGHPCVLDKTIETKALVPEATLRATAPGTIALLGRDGPFTEIRTTFLACVLIRVPAAPDAPATVVTGGLGRSKALDAAGT